MVGEATTHTWAPAQTQKTWFRCFYDVVSTPSTACELKEQKIQSNYSVCSHTAVQELFLEVGLTGFIISTTAAAPPTPYPHIHLHLLAYRPLRNRPPPDWLQLVFVLLGDTQHLFWVVKILIRLSVHAELKKKETDDSNQNCLNLKTIFQNNLFQLL